MIVVNARFMAQQMSGVQRYALELCQALYKLDKNIIFVAPKEEFLIKTNLEIQKVGSFNGHLWEQISLPKYLRKIGSPLLINFTGVGPVFYKNKIITIHDLSFIYNPTWFSKKYVLYYKIMTRLSVKTSKRILTVSKYSKKEIIRFLKTNTKKIDVIHNAVSWKSKENKSKENIILSVSSLDPRKNLKNVIKAFKKADLPDYKLVIVGAGNKVFRNKDLYSDKKDNENIIFTGYVSDKELVELYLKAKLFLYISLYEGFGIPPIEAMKMNTPTIVSNVTSLPEVCKDASLYVDPENVVEISKAIKLIISDDKKQEELVQKGRIVCENYSWDKSAEKLFRIINNI